MKVITGDILVIEGDTVYGAAMRVGWRAVDWIVKANAADADSCQFMIGYQMYLNGSWTGLKGELIYTVEDSLVLQPNVPAELFLILPTSGWVRPAAVGISTTGNVRIDTLKALTRVL